MRLKYTVPQNSQDCFGNNSKKVRCVDVLRKKHGDKGGYEQIINRKEREGRKESSATNKKCSE